MPAFGQPLGPLRRRRGRRSARLRELSETAWFIFAGRSGGISSPMMIGGIAHRGKSMSEAKWLASTESDGLLFLLDGKASERELRLFCCACVRRVWYRLRRADASRRAVEVAEEFADEQRTEQDLAHSLLEAERAMETASLGKKQNALRAAAWCVRRPMDASSLARSVAWGVVLASQEAQDVELAAQAHLLRDVFGNPFRPRSIDPVCHTPTVKAIAEAAYEERTSPAGHLDLARLAVLADALEEAGCTDADILSHCREPGPHVRGCWALDLALGKKRAPLIAS